MKGPPSSDPVGFGVFECKEIISRCPGGGVDSERLLVLVNACFNFRLRHGEDRLW